MPCASGRGDPSCSGLLDCQSTRAPVPLNRQPPENHMPTRGVNRLGGIQPGAATFTMVGSSVSPGRRPGDPMDGRENSYDNGLARQLEGRGGKTAFQAGGPADTRGVASPGPISRPIMDLQEQRRRQIQQSADDLADERRKQAQQAQQALQHVQAQQQAQREQMAREREELERQQMRRKQMEERQWQEEQQRTEALQQLQLQQLQQQQQQQHTLHQAQQRLEPEPHWVRKVQELSKISHLFPLTMAPPADNDFFLYPHLDHGNKRDPQQRRPMMPRQPGAVDRRKTAAEEHEEMVLALRDALSYGTVKLTQPVGSQTARSSEMATPTKGSSSSRGGSPYASGGQPTPYSSADTQRNGRESPSVQMYHSVQACCPMSRRLNRAVCLASCVRRLALVRALPQACVASKVVAALDALRLGVLVPCPLPQGKETPYRNLPNPRTQEDFRASPHPYAPKGQQTVHL
jgi:hypothetical protein